MKRSIAVLIIILITVTALAACGNSTVNDGTNGGNEENTTSAQGVNLVIGDDALNFTADNNVEITPNKEAKPIIEALGEPLEYIETASCGFDDMDRTYKYNGFVIDTVTINGVEYIYTVEIINDLISTPEGAYIGMTLAEIKDIYAGKYKMEDGHVVVEFVNGSMRCFIKNDVCTSITYQSTTIPNLEEQK